MSDEKEIDTVVEIQNKEIELENLKQDFWFKILGGVIPIAAIISIFCFSSLLISDCNQRNENQKQLIINQRKEFDKNYEECVLQLGINTCKNITNILHEEDDSELLSNSYGKCIEKLGIEKCKNIKENNEHVHVKKEITDIKKSESENKGFTLVDFIVYFVWIFIWINIVRLWIKERN